MMKTLLFLAGCMLANLAALAQVATQDFDASTSWAVTLNPPDGTFQSTADVWGVRDPASFSFVSVGSGNFLAARDVENPDNPNGTFVTGTFASQSVDPAASHVITFDYDIVGYDGGDRVSYEVVVDGVAGPSNNVFVGSTAVKDASGTETISVPAGASTIGLIITVVQNGGSDYAGLDNFVLDVEVSMPVALTSFTADAMDTGAKLEWEVASQRDNDYFGVEMSRDGSTFEEVGRVFGDGTSDDYTAFDFEYRTDEPGDYYFRLRQVDYDGAATYTPVVSVRIGSATAADKLAVLQVAGEGAIQVTSPLNADLAIVSMTGAVVARHRVREGRQTVIDVSTLPGGIYLVTDGITSRRIVR